MTEQAQAGGTAFDVVKLVGAAILLVGGVAAFYLLTAQPIWLRWIIVMVTFGLSVAVAVQSQPGTLLWQFVQSSRVELRKVVWPTRAETIQVTIVVFAMILFLGVFFWGLDSALGAITRWLTGRGA
jgi:preprotein translocase subunit SecE